MIEELLKGGGKSLEIGPGYLPAIPIREGSYFVDPDDRAVVRLRKAGGEALLGSAEKLPYRSGIFDLVCAFEVLEHVEGDERAFSEIRRVLKEGGVFVFSVPLFEEYWSLFDKLAGHKRRYHPLNLLIILEKLGFRVERFLCPRNLYAFMVENRLLRLLIVWLRALLALVEMWAPACLAWLCKLFALSPLGLFKRMDRVSWEDGSLGRVEDRCQIVIVCRKSTKH